MPYPLLGSQRTTLMDKGFALSTLGHRTDDEKAKDCQKYLMVLAEQRLPWEPLIDNIIAYVNHGRRFIQDTDTWPGQQTGQEVFDDSAMLARNKMRDGMVGSLCSRNEPWFALEIPGKFNFPQSSGLRSWSGKRVDSYPQVIRWLQDSQEVMYSAFNRSNFYDVVTEFISDGITCGTAHLIVEEDVARATDVFTVPHFRECFIAENQFREVDTCYRVYRMTLKQLVEKFGMEVMERVDNTFENDYKNNMYAERQILHAIYPRKDYQPGRVDARNKLWESMWVYPKGGGKLMQPGANGKVSAARDVFALAQGGYDSMPIITWRYNVNSDETYGRGPSHDAFVSIAQINQMGRTNLITAHQAAEPPLVAYSDLRGAIQRGPAGITYLESNRGDIRARAPIPLYTGVNQLPFSVEYQDRVKQIINEHFHTDVFAMMSQLAAAGQGARMVADYVQELQGEKAAILGTRVGRLQSEAFNPLISRVYSIEAGAGRIPQPPDILLNSVHGPVQVQYLGPLAQAQTRLSKVRAIQSFVNLIQPLVAVHPAIAYKVNPYRTANLLAEAVMFPQECLNSDDEVRQVEEQMSKQAEHEQMVEAMPKAAQVAKALAKAPEAGSIMQQMMGGEGGTA